MAVEIAQLLSSCLAGMKKWVRPPEPGREWRVGKWYCLWCPGWEGRGRQIPGACWKASRLSCNISGHRGTMSQNQNQSKTKEVGSAQWNTPKVATFFLWPMLFNSSHCLQQGEDFSFFDFLSEFYSFGFCDEGYDPMGEILLCSL